MTPQQVCQRLEQYSGRIRNGSLSRVRTLWTIWQSYNSPDNPLRMEGLLRHQSATSINLLASAALHESILIITRAFDRVGRDGPERTERVSFPVMRDLSRLEGVEEELLRKVEGWNDGWNSAQNRETVRSKLEEFRGGLERLEQEQPNRLQLLRDFRDEFLAHNLERRQERDRPLFQHVTEIIEEMTQLSDHAELAFCGADVCWDLLNDQTGESATALWRVIHDGAVHQGRVAS